MVDSLKLGGKAGAGLDLSRVARLGVGSDGCFGRWRPRERAAADGFLRLFGLAFVEHESSLAMH